MTTQPVAHRDEAAGMAATAAAHRDGRPLARWVRAHPIGAFIVWFFPVAWAIRLWVDDEPLLGRAEDASRKGLWVTIAPTMALKLGKICWIDVMSDEVGSFTLAGEVRHISGRRVGLETMRPVPIDELERG